MFLLVRFLQFRPPSDPSDYSGDGAVMDPAWELRELLESTLVWLFASKHNMLKWIDANADRQRRRASDPAQMVRRI
jgi:hypothetical protein